MIDIICPQCSLPFETKDQRRKFCSRKCADDAQKKPSLWIDRECLTCGSLVKITDRNSKYRKFCNHSCAAKYANSHRGKHSENTKSKISESLKKFHDKKPKVKTLCQFCQSEFEADRKSCKYCSNECRILVTNKKIKDKLSYRTFQKIIKRAFPDWRCPFCQFDFCYEIHHIKPRKDGGNENTNNLILLCPNCHRKAQSGVIEEEMLKQYTIGTKYSADEMMEKFYYGKNKEFFMDKTNCYTKRTLNID